MHVSMTVPLARLAIDEIANVRKTGRGMEPAFVASIRAKGIIEPLTVRKNGRGFKVVNGGKRLEALQWMEAHGEAAAGVAVDGKYEVPVTVRDEDDREARDTSLIANIVHAPMHPVDEFEAFAALSAEGMQVAEIDARYALEEKQVRQRLALGALSPRIRDAWRVGEIGARQAEAFTLAPTAKDQERVFDKLNKSGELRYGDHVIRQAFVGKQNDVGKLVSFVGPDALREAGIDLREDLFGTAHTVPDPAVVKKLADEKLTAACTALTEAGWSWASPAAELPEGATWSWAKRPRPGVGPSGGQAGTEGQGKGDRQREGQGRPLMSEEYRPITTTFRRVSPTGLAIMVDRPPGQGHDWAVIPRSLIHGGDDLKVAGFAAGDAITIRIMAWKADALGWQDRPPAPEVKAPPRVTLKQGRLL